MAMGASRGSILSLTAGQSFRLVGVGLVIGLAGTIAFTRVLSSILFQLSVHDPFTLAIAAFVLIGVGVIACHVPALRATRVDPITALRGD